MKKSFYLAVVVGVFVLFSIFGKAYAEDDEKLCEYHGKLFKALQKDAQSMGNGFQDLLSKKSDYGKMIFLIQTSQCRSFKKEHEADLPSLHILQKEVTEELEKKK